MARLIFTPTALSIVAKEQYALDEKAQEKLFAYYKHLDAKDYDSAMFVYREWSKASEIAMENYQKLKHQHESWVQWREEQEQQRGLQQ